MICPTCKIPMKTEEGSECGNMLDDYYETQEIKVCPKCQTRVQEIYIARILLD
ncbi:hypothetical protein LCGC14_1599470 [marine sediment metagenome]|uniref:Uncharacterized protein n=1 Tax=marine sediment metagenome TaxID=412755 RepID=A0A0F9IBX3_9ZZZZ